MPRQKKIVPAANPLPGFEETTELPTKDRAAAHEKKVNVVAATTLTKKAEKNKNPLAGIQDLLDSFGISSDETFQEIEEAVKNLFLLKGVFGGLWRVKDSVAFIEVSPKSFEVLLYCGEELGEVVRFSSGGVVNDFKLIKRPWRDIVGSYGLFN